MSVLTNYLSKHNKMATTAEKIVENFPHKTIQAIIGQPTCETLAILHLILNTNAASVHSNRGNGQLGLTFLTLSGAVCTTLSSTPFVPESTNTVSCEKWCRDMQLLLMLFTTFEVSCPHQAFVNFVTFVYFKSFLLRPLMFLNIASCEWFTGSHTHFCSYKTIIYTCSTRVEIIPCFLLVGSAFSLLLVSFFNCRRKLLFYSINVVICDFKFVNSLS